MFRRESEYAGRLSVPAAGGGDGGMSCESVHGLLHGTPTEVMERPLQRRCSRVAGASLRAGMNLANVCLLTRVINQPGLKMREYDQFIYRRDRVC
jgi:hypothetical protein